MQFGDDDRGQSIQIGAIILFGALIILLSTYQAFVVPNQNREVEFKHSQTVQNDMKELRSALISASDGTRSSVSVQLGTEYPSRAIFVNPGPPSGRLRTVGTTNRSINATVLNASASGDTGDFWDGDARNYSTGELVYTPNYNVYQNAPTTVYSNTVLYNRFDGESLTMTDQTLVDGRSISLVALNGSVSAGQAGSVSVDVRPRSASQTRVAVTNASAGENVTLKLPTRLSESKWKRLLREENVTNGGHVYDVDVNQVPGSRFDQLVVELESEVTYNLKMSKVAVGGARGDGSPASYLVKTQGNGMVVPEGEQTTIEVQARDKYNNPVSGEVVQASAEQGGFVDGEDVVETDSDGTATFVYDAPDSVSGSVSETVNVSLNADAHNVSKPGDVSFSLTISGGGGADPPPYTIAFDTSQMDSANPGLTCTSERCTYDFGEDKTDTGFELTAETFETVIGTNVDFALNTTSYGAYTSEDSQTDQLGEATAFFRGNNTGTLAQYVSSGASSDALDVELTDTSKVISAFDNNPTGDDSKYEFVRLYFAEPQDTTGWTLEDDETQNSVTNLPSEQLSGEVYFARNGSEFADRWGIDIDRVYNLSTALADSGEPLWLNDSTGNVVDNIEYDDNSEDPDDGIINMENDSDVGVRVLLDGTYPYKDTNDNDADWQKKDEADVLGSVAGGGFQSQSVSDLLPSTSGQRQTFTFTPDVDIPTDTKVAINLTEAQQVSPRQVDYQGGVVFTSTGSASLDKKNADEAWLNWTKGSSLSAGTKVEIVVDDVKTGPDSNQASQYSVKMTRKDTNTSTTGIFEVGRSTGGSELDIQSISDLSKSSSGQEQKIVFEPETNLPKEQAVQIDLSDAAGSGDVDYTDADLSVDRSESELTFTDQNIDNASILYSPNSDLSAGTRTEITISSVSTGDMSNAPYTVGIGRSDAGTESTTFDTKGPAFFDVTITGTNSPVTEGETLSVDVDVNNTGGTTDSQTIELYYDDTGDGNANTLADSQTVSDLAPGDPVQSITLDWETESGDAGDNIPINVTSNDDSDTDQVTVEAADANQISLNNDSVDTVPGANTKIEFDLENVDESAVDVTAISVDSTDTSATYVEDEDDGIEFEGAGGSLNQRIDIGGATESMDTDATINGGATETFELGQFRDGPGNGGRVNMRNQQAVITLTFGDGSTKEFTLNT